MSATPASCPADRVQPNGVVQTDLGEPGRQRPGAHDQFTFSEAEEDLAFAAKTGFDPRLSAAAFLYFRVVPARIQAWREENELAGRTIMRDGRWLVS